MNNITREDIAEFINIEFGLTKKDCNLLVKDIIDEIENQTVNLLTKHKRYMVKIANSLLKNETITYKEIKTLVPKRLENTVEIKI